MNEPQISVGNPYEARFYLDLFKIVATVCYIIALTIKKAALSVRTMRLLVLGKVAVTFPRPV